MSDGAYVLVLATYTRVCQGNSDSTFLQLVVVSGQCGARIILPQNDVSSECIPIAMTILTSLSNSTNAKPFERPLSSRIIRTSLTAPYCPPIFSPHAKRTITAGGTHRLEQAFEVLLRDELAETSDVNFAIVRVAVRALLLPLRVGDQHRELAALFHVCTIQLQRSLRGRLANRDCQSPCSH